MQRHPSTTTSRAKRKPWRENLQTVEPFPAVLRRVAGAYRAPWPKHTASSSGSPVIGEMLEHLREATCSPCTPDVISPRAGNIRRPCLLRVDPPILRHYRHVWPVSRARACSVIRSPKRKRHPMKRWRDLVRRSSLMWRPPRRPDFPDTDIVPAV